MPSPVSLDSFLAALPALGFMRQGTLLSKTIGSVTLGVDEATQQLLYPEDQGLVINERQTCNFNQPENPSDLKFYWKGVAYDTHSCRAALVWHSTKN
ncbi:MAG: hypothetical protein JNM65_05740 [Verrucomicrobiaceae bacterium]|nr:hypothetical protein [Verrucomicrobiaceae bacterium]